jgi:hypothetical protein
MAIALRAAGTATASGTAVTSINPAVPTGATTGDLSVLSVAIKPYNATVTTPSGWTKIGEATNGTTAAGTDTGSMKVAVFVRESASVGAIGNMTFGSADSVVAVINTYSKGGTEVWNYSSFTTGGDTTNGANFSATGAANIGITTNDWAHATFAVNGDVGTVSAATVTATGATLGTANVRPAANGAVTTTGGDARLIVVDRACTAGPSSAAPVATYTNASSTSGTVLFLRLRASVPLPLTETLTDDFAVDNRATKWPQSYGVTNVTGGVATVTASGATDYNGLMSAEDAYDLTGSYVKVKMTMPSGTGTYAAVTLTQTSDGNDLCALWVGGTLSMGQRTAYSFGTPGTVAVSAGASIYVGVGEGVAGAAHFGGTGTAGNFYWFTSPDGSTWTQRKTAATPAYVSALTLMLECGEGSGTATYDNFNVASSVNYTQDPADPAGVTDSGTAIQAMARAMDDPVGGTDSAAAVQANTRMPADSAGLTDSAMGALDAVRAPADTAGGTDSVSYTLGTLYTPTPADNAGVTDTATPVQAVVRTPADSAGATDAVTLTVTRGPADSAGGSDSAAAVQTTVRTSADAAGATDSAARAHDMVRSVRRPNLAVNPELEVDASGWVSGGSITRVLHNGKYWLQGDADTYTYASVPLVAGKYYAISARFSGTPGEDVLIYSTDNWVGAITEYTLVTIPGSGEVVARAKSTVAAAQTMTGNFGLYTAPGQTVKITEAFIEEVSGPGLHAGEYYGDTAGITDSVSYTLGAEYQKTPADSAGATDSASASTDFVRTPADSAGATDATALAVTRSPADNAGLTDTPAAVQALVRAPADSAGGTDSATDVMTMDRGPADSAGGTDSATPIQALARTQDDSAGASDSAAAATDFVRTPADPAGATDATALARSISAGEDDAAATDSATRALDAVRTAADNAGLTDTALVERGANPADTASGADAVSFTMTRERTVDDPAGLTDTGIGSLVAQDTILDNAGATDTAAAVQATSRTAADAAGATDAATAVQSTIQAPADSAGGTDATTATWDRVREVADTASASDSAAPVQGTARTAQDSAGATDAADATQDHTRNPDDPAGLLDAEVHVQASARTLADPAGLTDSVTAVLSATEDLADTAGGSDAATATVAAQRAASDTIGATDNQTPVQGMSRLLADAGDLTDATAWMGTAERVHADAATLTDSVTIAWDRASSKGDTAGLTDASTESLDAVRLPDDTAGMTDAVTVLWARVIEVTINDPLGIIDRGRGTGIADAVIVDGYIAPPTWGGSIGSGSFGGSVGEGYSLAGTIGGSQYRGKISPQNVEGGIT